MNNISVLYSEEELALSVKKLGAEITEEYKGKKLLVVCVLKGAFVFTADLVRSIDNDMQIAFITAKSYVCTSSTGNVSISGDHDFMGLDLREWDVLLVEDILDTGRTLCELKKKFASMGAPSVKIAVMLDKPSRRVADITPDFKCYEIEDKFVVGCGLDYDERYRNLPFIGIVSE